MPIAFKASKYHDTKGPIGRHASFRAVVTFVVHTGSWNDSLFGVPSPYPYEKYCGSWHLVKRNATAVG
jgi:hypothetical protein